jgi:hypothetical protein
MPAIRQGQGGEQQPLALTLVGEQRRGDECAGARQHHGGLERVQVEPQAALARRAVDLHARDDRARELARGEVVSAVGAAVVQASSAPEYWRPHCAQR